MKLKNRLYLVPFILVFTLIIVFGGNLKVTFVGDGINNSIFKLFFDYGDGYAEDNALAASWTNGKVTIPIGDYCKNCKNIRLDPIDTDVEEVMISEISFRLWGVRLYKIDASTLSKHLIIMNDISDIRYQDNQVCFSITGKDPYCRLDESLLNVFCAVSEKIAFIKILFSLVAFLVLYMISIIIIEKWGGSFFDFIKTINKNVIIIALLHWGISFFFQPLFFEFPTLNVHTYNSMFFWKIVFFELLFLSCLLYIWHEIFCIIKKFADKENKRKYCEFVKCWLPYLIVLIIILFLIWPGYFCSDEYVMLDRARNWSVFSIQHYLIGVSYIVIFMFLPFSSGIQIAAALFISMIVGYIVYKTRIFLNYSKIAYLLYIPFLLPASLIMNFRVLNSVISGYLELFLIFEIIVLKYENRIIGKKELCFFIILSAIQPVLREDGLFFIFAPFILWFVFKDKIKKLHKTILVIGTLSLVMLLKLPQTACLEAEFNIPKRHSIQCFNRLVYTPLMLSDAVKDKDELADINVIFDVEAYKKSTSLDEADTVARETLNKNISANDVDSYVAACIKLILKYPVSYLHQQWETFLNTSSLKSDDYNTQDSTYTFEHDETYPLYTQLEEVKENTVAFRPFSNTLRKNVINFLEGKELNNWHEPTLLHKIFWNLVPSILFLMVFGIWSIRELVINKNRLFIGISILVLARLPILFLTAPYSQFMYWFRFYITGNLVAMFFVVDKFYKRNLLKS